MEEPYIYMYPFLPQDPLPSRLPHNIEQSSVSLWFWGKGRRVVEGILRGFGIGMYTLLYLKWMPILFLKLVFQSEMCIM